MTRRQTKIDRITAEILTSIMDDILIANECGTLIQLITGTNHPGIMSMSLPLKNHNDEEIDRLYEELVSKGAYYPWDEKDYYASKKIYLNYLSIVNKDDEWLIQ